MVLWSYVIAAPFSATVKLTATITDPANLMEYRQAGLY